MQAGEGLTAVRFDDSGLQCAAGTSNGLVALFDLRMARPTTIKDHMYGEPITDIKFHQPRGDAGGSVATQERNVLAVMVMAAYKCHLTIWTISLHA